MSNFVDEGLVAKRTLRICAGAQFALFRLLLVDPQSAIEDGAPIGSSSVSPPLPIEQTAAVPAGHMSDRARPNMVFRATYDSGSWRIAFRWLAPFSGTLRV